MGDHSLIRERARLDAASMIGHGGVIGRDCRIGARSKLMAGAILGHDMVFDEDVFCGPGLSVTDDPRWAATTGSSFRSRRSAGMPGRCERDAHDGPRHRGGGSRRRGIVVTKDVAARTVVFGVPAHFVREVTDAELRERHPPADRSRA